MKYSLVGVDGNAFKVMGYVRRAMRDCGKPQEEGDAYVMDAMNGDYDHLLAVSVTMLDALNGEAEENAD
jgi:hypothetical protein